MSEVLTEAIHMPKGHAREIWKWLGNMAQPHADADPNFVIIDGYQDDAPNLFYHLKGQPVPSSSVEPVASLVEARFPLLLEATAKGLERKPHVMASVGEALRSGFNVGLFTDHNSLPDIAFMLAAIYDRFGKSRRYSKLFDDEAELGLVASKMLARVGVKFNPEHDPVPAERAVLMTAHNLWSTFPTAPSAREVRKLWPTTVDRHNNAATSSLNSRQDQGGLLWAMAPEGTKQKVHPDDPDTLVMHPATNGTKKMMMHRKTLGLFVAVLFEGDAVRLEFSTEDEDNLPGGVLRSLNSPEDVDSAMMGLADTCNEITTVENRRFDYHSFEEYQRLFAPKNTEGY